MQDELDRFQEIALSLDDVEVVVPPGYEEDAVREDLEQKPRSWKRLKLSVRESILSSLSKARDTLAQLQEKERALEEELEDMEQRRDAEIEKLESKLRRAIAAALPDASDFERRRFFDWIRHGPESFANELAPDLWKEQDDLRLWYQYKEKFRKLNVQTRPLGFHLSMVRVLKREATVGALPERDEVADQEASPTSDNRTQNLGRPPTTKDELLETLRQVIQKLDDQPGESLTTTIFDQIPRDVEGHLRKIRNRHPEIDIPEKNRTEDWRDALPDLKDRF